MMSERKVIIDTGNSAVAYAVKDAEAKVIAAYPITPQTTIVEKIAQFIEYGEMDAKMIRVESEHSAMAAIIGSEAMGVRSFTATSSHGLALMHEMLWYAANARLPVVMAVANRTLGPPWNIWADWGDAMADRDIGWIISWAANNQEVYDFTLISYRVAEDKRVALPAMVNLEAFVLTHTSMPFEICGKEAREFLPEYDPIWKLDPDDPVIMGNIFSPADTMKLRWDMWESIKRARKVILGAIQEYNEMFNRDYEGLIKTYRMDDADYAIVSMGTIGEEAEVAVDALREEGLKVGAIRINFFRPFPREDLVNVLNSVSRIIIIERSASLGAYGQILQDLGPTILLEKLQVDVNDVFMGIGGTDVSYEDIVNVVKRAIKGELKTLYWYGSENW
ncbi:MAG: pyruvate ferredoxin oxidoreductase [Thermoplasmata archaeon]|nr:MAG: pyruvate ferredoxin oxidoreductase [Thermoplasmata archaeon]